MLSDEWIKELVEEKWALELRVSGCISWKKEDLESLVKQALEEGEEDLKLVLNELTKANETIKKLTDVLIIKQTHITNLNSSIKKLTETLEKLSRLGNGDELGNSEGNMIARQALKEVNQYD
jgi:archaellum biogenesis ATPase FlaH